MHKAQGIPLTVWGRPSPTVLQTGPFCLDIGSRHSTVDMMSLILTEFLDSSQLDSFGVL
jgi:hypothetical protein